MCILYLCFKYSSLKMRNTSKIFFIDNGKHFQNILQWQWKTLPKNVVKDDSTILCVADDSSGAQYWRALWMARGRGAHGGRPPPDFPYAGVPNGPQTVCPPLQRCVLWYLQRRNRKWAIYLYQILRPTSLAPDSNILLIRQKAIITMHES